MENLFRSFMPAFSQMSAPPIDLLKASSGAQKVKWSIECETVFNLIKSTLISAPVLRHFDSTLPTAVHVDGSQNAVGAVLLQWRPGASAGGFYVTEVGWRSIPS